MRKLLRFFSFEERSKKAGTIAYYIEKVVSYRSKHEAAENLESSYPPVVPELLLSLLIEVRTLFTFARFLICFLLCLLFKAIFLGS